MEMEAFIAQSPLDAAMVREHINAAVLSLGMAQQCIARLGAETPTTVDFHRYLAATLWEVEAAQALVPRA